MGGGSSSCQASDDSVATLEQALPSYHVKNLLVSEEDVALAKASWDLILNDKSPEYMRLLSGKNPITVSCLVWFYDSFYERLFEIHPTSREQFKGSMKKQGMVLVKIIGISIGLRDEESRVSQILVSISKSHAVRGIKAHEYGIAGEVLMWTLELCLGKTVFDKKLNDAWIRIYSAMLNVLVPAAIEEEKKLSATQRSQYSMILNSNTEVKQILTEADITTTNSTISQIEVPLHP